MASIVTARYVSFDGHFHRTRDAVKLFSSRALQLVGATVCNRKRLQWATSPSSNILNISGTRDINDVSSFFFLDSRVVDSAEARIVALERTRGKGNSEMIILQFFTGDTFFLPIAEENWKKGTRKLLFHLLVFHTKYLLMHFAHRDILLYVIF